MRFVRTVNDMSHDETDDETARCGLGARCESDGAPGPGLRVVALDVLGARICLTLCPSCRAGVAAGRLPSILVTTAARLADEHRAHREPVAERRVIRLRADGA